MTAISRRSFLAGTAAFIATPSVTPAVAALPREVDVAVIGAGAAGIAAARRLAAARRSVVLLEAANRIGGRCQTDTTTFGLPFDRGAHWLYAPDSNPLVALAQPAGVDVYRAPQGQRIRIGRRYAREGEMEDYFATLVRAQRALSEPGRGLAPTDQASAVLLREPAPPMPAKGAPKAAAKAPKETPKDTARDMGDWAPLVQFSLGPLLAGKDLADVSATDLVRAAERHPAAFCRQGVGTLLEKLALGVPVATGAPVSRVAWNGPGVTLDLPQGTLRARAVIVTVAGPVLTEGQLRFTPDLPKRVLEAYGRLAPGHFEQIALRLADNPLGLEPDEVVFEKAESARTGLLLANTGGSDLSVLGIGGSFARDLAGQGADAMTAFAADWLVSLYGADLRKAIRRTATTRWSADPFAQGAWSAAAPGQAAQRRVLVERVGDRIWFAGEATHETGWGTVAGAWESGERAAADVLTRLGPPQAARPEPPKPKAPKQAPRPQAPRNRAPPG